MVDIEIRTERVQLADAAIQVTVAGDGPLVVLVHGFPELAYSWRHQIRALAAAGYRVVAPDMRGYGASDCPDDVTAYDLFHLVGDVVGLIEHAGGGPAVVVGHDWGAMVAWTTALFRPDLLAGVVGVSVPYAPPGPASIPDLVRATVGDDGFHYLLYFQEPGLAEVELDADPLDTMRRLFWAGAADDASLETGASGPRSGFLPAQVPAGIPPWLDPGDFEAYGRAFLRTGFTGGLNWYRNMHRNWELMAPWRGAPITIPAAFVAGRQDPVLTATGDLNASHSLLELQAAHCADLRVTLIDGAGHWTQQERPNETSAALLAFLADVQPTA